MEDVAELRLVRNMEDVAKLRLYQKNVPLSPAQS